MAYTAPTPALFKARYPEFKDVSDEMIDLVLDESISDVGDSWLERDRARAQMLLAAHKLTLEGEPTRSITGVGGAALGSIKRDKVGDVETEFTGAGAGVIASANSLGLTDTPYGMEFIRLRKRSFAGMRAV